MVKLCEVLENSIGFCNDIDKQRRQITNKINLIIHSSTKFYFTEYSKHNFQPPLKKLPL
jgi:hypothetical protein